MLCFGFTFLRFGIYNLIYKFYNSFYVFIKFRTRVDYLICQLFDAVNRLDISIGRRNINFVSNFALLFFCSFALLLFCSFALLFFF